MSELERFLKWLRECSKELAPDYPFRDESDHWEQLWAITEGYKGTKAACEDLHAEILSLRAERDSLASKLAFVQTGHREDGR
jgi:hypothetical protein